MGRLLFSSFFPAAAVLSSPSILISENGRELLLSMWLFYAIPVVFLALTLVVFFLEDRVPRFTRVLAFLGLYLFMLELLRPWLGDPARIRWKVALLFDVSLIGFLIFAWKQRKYEVERFFCSVLAVCIIFLSAYRLWNSYSMFTDARRTMRGVPLIEIEKKGRSPEINVTPNVYHFVLDAFQNEALETDLEDYRDFLDGFTYYRNYYSGAFSTVYAMYQLLTSQLHQGEGHAKLFKNLAESEFYRVAEESEIAFHQNHYANVFCSKFTKCNALIQDFAGFQNYIIVDISLLRLIPATVSFLLHRSLPEESRNPRLWGYGRSFSSMFINERAKPLYPLLAVKQFEHFEKFSATQPRTGQYFFNHLMLPHGPFLLNENCEVDTQGGRVAQHKCSMKLIRRFVGQLKERGDFDKSLIIVHSDHGSYLHPEALQKDGINKYKIESKGIPKMNMAALRTDEVASEVLDTIGHGLLLIKFPGQKSFRISDEFVQIRDIVPTALNHFGIQLSKTEGRVIRSDSKLPFRSLSFQVIATGAVFYKLMAEKGQRYKRNEFGEISVYKKKLGAKWEFQRKYRITH